MLSVYYLTLAFLVAVTNAVVLQKEGLENVLDVGPDYAKGENSDNSNLKMLGVNQNFPAKSCKEIYDTNPYSRSNSGYYWVKSLEGTAKVYCEMLQSISGLSGWTMIANLKGKANCSSVGWGSNDFPAGCRSPSDKAGCYSAVFSTNASSSGYSKVSGYIIGHQKGTTDAFAAIKMGDSVGINGTYLDGVSITQGDPEKQERKHLFSYAVGFSSDFNSPALNCPCAKYRGPAPPNFVRNDYFCDSGATNRASASQVYYSSLFEDKNCKEGNNCCAQVESPWFYKLIPGNPVTDAIEVRICGDEDWSEEGTIISEMKLYIQ